MKFRLEILSINKEAGTVDIVSDGIVKNLSLYGKDDYDNYEINFDSEFDSLFDTLKNIEEE